MKYKHMDFIGGNKKFFILAICLMGLMFGSCHFHCHYYGALLESGEIKKHNLPLSADIKMEVFREPYYESFDSLINVSIYKKRGAFKKNVGILPNYNFSQLDIRCKNGFYFKVTKYMIKRPRFENRIPTGSKWVEMDTSFKEENHEDKYGEIYFGFIPPHKTDTLLIIPNNFMILSDGTPLFKDTVKIIMDSAYFPKYKEKKKNTKDR
ncbi:MAG: hypothetical protein J5867_02290 [Prevotella sp.]|nr:hypothetical protein [Prevotella sp.]MBQ6062755.1 hypothetical protein [Prevotella sp.]